MKGAILLSTAALLLQAAYALADAPPPATDATRSPETVEVSGTKSPGAIEYRRMYKVQKFLSDILPPEPRHIDIKFRIEHKNNLSGSVKHSTTRLYIVGENLDQPVPLDDADFFVLPELPPSQIEGAFIQSSEKKGAAAVTLAVLLRTNGKQRIPYRDLAYAIDEAGTATSRLPWYVRWFGLGSARLETAVFCFKATGSIKVGPTNYKSEAKTNCARFDFDSSLAKQNPDIQIDGSLAYASLELKQAEKIQREP